MSRPSLVRALPFLLAAVCSAAMAGEELPGNPVMDLFQRGKTAFKLGNYGASLETFEKLDALGRSASEADRARLLPAIAFYRGANLTMLGETDQARAQLELYIELVPAARLDPGAFPRQVITLFEAVRKSAQGGSEASGKRSSEEGWMVSDYERYQPGPGHSRSSDPSWADGAIRFLMTSKERETWQGLTDDTQRGEFIATFWERRDPTRETPENELRGEIERRIGYADAHFAQEETRGSATDRGIVFVLLGPPSYVGQKPFKSTDDPVQAARASPTREGINTFGRGTALWVPRAGLTAETLQGTREIWHYRRDRLPNVVKFTDVDFEFITKTGLGVEVLQRDHTVLTALDQAARATLPVKD